MIMVLLLGVFTSCENLEKENPVPEFRVELTLNLLQDAPMLDIQGGYYEITKPFKVGQYLGYGGLMIFHTFDDKFVAYDMCCPHEASDTAKVSTEMTGMATCEKCKSVYDVGFSLGYPVSGPTRYPLRKYNVYQSGYILHVTN